MVEHAPLRAGKKDPPNCDGTFSLPYLLRCRRVPPIPAASARHFRQFQGRLANIYPEASWDERVADIADPVKRADFSHSLEKHATPAILRDQNGRPRPDTVSLMRAIRSLSSRQQDDDSDVAAAHAKAGPDSHRARELATAAGAAAAQSSAIPRSAPANPWV